MTSVKARDFRNRPVWLRALNWSWKQGYPLGLEVKLDKDRLIRAARRQTGLRDFGADLWEEPLDVLLQSINEEARLHPFGRFITAQRITNLLASRLRAEYWFHRHPEILEQELYPAFLIAGLQRTGTTKLQRLLGGAPGNRPLLSWEAINPAPFGDDPSETKKRVAQARLSEQALRLMAPGFFAIHPVEHLAPEEDVLLLDVSFMSTTTEATMHVPGYSRWLEQTDQSPAYAYLVKLLKLLQWQRPGKRWILKSPHHLEFLDLIARHFPQVHFLWTHRDVQDCIPSWFSMLLHGQAIFSDEVHPERTLRHWLQKLQYMLGQGMSFRQQNPGQPFTDVFYGAFIRDPIGTVAKIYQNQQIPFDEETRRSLEHTERQNHAGKYGKHEYDLADFDLTDQDLEPYTKEYQGFFTNLKNN